MILDNITGLLNKNQIPFCTGKTINRIYRDRKKLSILVIDVLLFIIIPA